MKKKWITLTIAAAILTSTAAGATAQTAHAAEPETIRYGSISRDVPDLQYRLKTLGYFETGVTSYFGSATQQSLVQFQKDYGIAADGIAGRQTWAMLKKVSVNKAELDMLAKIIHAEARGESYKGKVAVGAVVMNRLASSNFPDSVKAIIEERNAFTAVADGQYGLTPDKEAYFAALDAVRGYDPTNGALYYFNPETATSSWIWSRQQTTKIGRHIFAV
ncbi:cell wall hydrolase [Paenibacillus soyae]|uniref:Cell wall hydrolase n=1 Tax=Paenibacillus soyae TaxID=2969249 RepID=A0A9X2MM81_9BACL|nr:cell wall hydrolase [Paenibacillus soyae]MCR2802840.1 cell wall hydrolase [Paenibacillus soyae]